MQTRTHQVYRSLVDVAVANAPLGAILLSRALIFKLFCLALRNRFLPIARIAFILFILFAFLSSIVVASLLSFSLPPTSISSQS